MIPFCEIWSSGTNVSERLTDRILSVVCCDEAEDKSGRVTITLDDRPRWSDAAVTDLPAVGTVVEVIMGYREGPAVKMGSYLIDQIDVSSPPRTLSISGRSAQMPKAFRTPRTQSYHQKTLGDIFSDIAGRSGYEPQIDGELAGVVVRHVDQHNESDMAFGLRIAALHDAAARPVDGKLVVAKKGAGKAVSGASLATISIAEGDCSDWTFSYAARDEVGEAAGLGDGGSEAQRAAGDSRTPGAATGDSGSRPAAKGGVRGRWTDIRTGAVKEVTVGEEPYHDLPFSFHNEAEAEAACSSYRNKSLRGNSTFSCTLAPGNVLAQAEAKLILMSFRPYIPTDWRMKSVTHTFDGNGITTGISAEIFAEKQEDTVGNVKKTTPTKDDKVDPGAPPSPVVGGGDDVIHLPQ